MSFKPGDVVWIAGQMRAARADVRRDTVTHQWSDNVWVLWGKGVRQATVIAGTYGYKWHLQVDDQDVWLEHRDVFATREDAERQLALWALGR